jgi:hypothetical protein
MYEYIKHAYCSCVWVLELTFRALISIDHAIFPECSSSLRWTVKEAHKRACMHVSISEWHANMIVYGFAWTWLSCQACAWRISSRFDFWSMNVMHYVTVHASCNVYGFEWQHAFNHSIPFVAAHVAGSNPRLHFFPVILKDVHIVWFSRRTWSGQQRPQWVSMGAIT